MATRPEEGDRLHPDTRVQWRAWLADHHGVSDGVWVVFWRRRSDRDGLTYEDAVLEALCFGWIDGKGPSGRPAHHAAVPPASGQRVAPVEQVRIERCG